jgi:prepilin-type N-terminal cleavage/methylation domain-containing protein
MKLRTTGRRAGVTLAEMLVVIAIIALLMGLLIPAVVKVSEAGARAETNARLMTTSSVISTFNNDQRFGQVKYIPAGRVDLNPSSLTFQQVVGPFRVRNTYPAAGTATTGEPDVNSFEAQYIIRVFGVRPTQTSNGPAIDNLGNPNLRGDLDANQTLLFFLGGITTPDAQGNLAFNGFSNDTQKPFTPAVQGEERKSVGLEMSRKRYEVSQVNGFARLIDGYGRPFAYFVAYNAKPGKYGGWNKPLHDEYGLGLVQPYQHGGKYVNETGFQLISAGRDADKLPQGGFGVSGDWAKVDINGEDDLANFSKSTLAAGPQ